MPSGDNIKLIPPVGCDLLDKLQAAADHFLNEILFPPRASARISSWSFTNLGLVTSASVDDTLQSSPPVVGVGSNCWGPDVGYWGRAGRY